VFVADRPSVVSGSLSANMVSGGAPLMNETGAEGVGSYILSRRPAPPGGSRATKRLTRLYQAATHSLTRSVGILGVELRRKFKSTDDTVLTGPGTNNLDRHRTLAVISTVRHGSGCSPTRHWLE
jgi:hypothetical protein